jgi:hypothetical protein
MMINLKLNKEKVIKKYASGKMQEISQYPSYIQKQIIVILNILLIIHMLNI